MEINLKDQKEMPVVEKSEFVDIDIPYKVTGWLGSVDLSKENQTVLKNEVLLKYSELREIINKGEIKEFLNQNKARDREVYEGFYNDKEVIAEDKQYLEERISKSKNNMVQINDYHVKMYGNGKVIALEKNDGKSALYADDSENLYYYVILLHRPKPGTPLEVIR
ncbi:hypothetical protein [Kaistella antarctica]|uniref:Uncharacterized protein n=1 Tax=Kaistella antarctica TaxID=266748 RepID=A0A3S5EUR9_9FLAO|nr:hypothetical protein [Kaistella antarctica]KEY18994.1 hypothetical protein HY04_11125 [Kaistella antarctica]VEH99111.1 Uncharacterised protein [Kaistella antarctica]